MWKSGYKTVKFLLSLMLLGLASLFQPVLHVKYYIFFFILFAALVCNLESEAE